MDHATIQDFETGAYTASAARGDVLPAIMRLAAARASAAWTDRAKMVLLVGASCPDDVLDMACSCMPRATEPLLLRAARYMRRALFDVAERDLASAALLDPMDATVLLILAELQRSRPRRVRASA